MLTTLEAVSAAAVARRASIVNDLYVGLVAERCGQAAVKLPLLAGHDEELSRHGTHSQPAAIVPAKAVALHPNLKKHVKPVVVV